MKRRHLFLIGFSGSGKSTLGPALAKRLGIPFLDTDLAVEKLSGCTISELFGRKGETAFRKLESQVIAEACRRKKGSVIALGGGAFEDSRNRGAVMATGVVVYLSCSQRELYRRMRVKTDRPLLAAKRKPADPATLRRRIGGLVSRRLKNYTKADIAVSTTNRSVGRTITLIRAGLRDISDYNNG